MNFHLQLSLQILAADALKGRRPDLGWNRKWEGNYLGMPSDNQNSSLFVSYVNGLKTKDKFQHILFSSFVKKVNKRNKCADRAILVTDRFIYKLDCKKFTTMKSPIAFTDVTGISISPNADQLIIIHLRGGNDLVVGLTNNRQENRTPELVGILCRLWTEVHKSDLKVNVNTQLQCMLGNKSRSLAVEINTGAAFPTFKKNGNGLVFVWP